MTAMDIISLILVLFSQIIRFLGLTAIGLGLGWVFIDLLKKTQAWQQVVLFLGLAGLVIAMVRFTGWGAVGGFTAGVGVALLLWGLPKKEKVEPEKKK
jgi:hypothetical protein